MEILSQLGLKPDIYSEILQDKARVKKALRALENFLESDGYLLLQTTLNTQFTQRLNLILNPGYEPGTMGSKEFMHGEMAAYQLYEKMPKLLVEFLKEDLETSPNTEE